MLFKTDFEREFKIVNLPIQTEPILLFLTVLTWRVAFC